MTGGFLRRRRACTSADTGAVFGRLLIKLPKIVRTNGAGKSKKARHGSA